MSEYNFTIAMISTTETKANKLKEILKKEEPYPDVFSATILKTENNVIYALWGASITQENNGGECDIPFLFQHLLNDGAEEIYGLYQDEHDESGIGEFIYANRETELDPKEGGLSELTIFSGEEEGASLFRGSDITDGTEGDEESDEYFYIDEDNIFDCFSHIISLHRSGELAVPEDSSENTGIDAPVGDEGETLLMWAAEDGNLEKVKTLLDQGADIHATDDRDFTPLFHSVNRPHVVRFLLEQGAEVNGRSHSKVTPLMRAAFKKNPETLQLLIGNGAEINAKCNLGYTALMVAVRDNRDANLEMARMLIENGAEINVNDQKKHSTLCYAIIWGRLETVELLINSGATIKPLKKYLKRAKEHKRPEITALLEKYAS